MENLDEFLDRQVKFAIIVEYYISFFPDILKVLTPVAVLISTLFSIGKLSNNNEITAMKSGGLSLYRLMLPLVIISLLLSIGQLYFNGWIVPKSNAKKIEIDRQYLSKNPENRTIFNLYFRDNPNRNILMQHYNADERAAYQVGIENFSSEKSPRLLNRIECEKMEWDTLKNSWKMINGIKRVFSDNLMLTTRFDMEYTKLSITHNQILKLKREPEEMNFDEIKEYIDILRIGGKDVRRQMIDYYSDYAFPFANFIVILFGVPFASVKKKGGIAIQIGAAMVIAFSYLLFTELSKTIGFSMELNPAIVGWSANVIFFIAGIIVLFKTKT